MPRTGPACPFVVLAALAIGCGSGIVSDTTDDTTLPEDGSGGSGPAGGGGTTASRDGGKEGSVGTSDATGPQPCVETCPAPKGGITSGCKKRFLYGVNYAWHTYSGDFGGLSSWQFDGIYLAPDGVVADFAKLQSAGVDVVRWWMFGDLRGDGITLDTSTGLPFLGTTVPDDVQTALDLAAQFDLHIQLTLFSFDAFSWNSTSNGLNIWSIAPIARDATKRSKLVETIIRPIAQAATRSKNRDRLVSWDVINEPEWATSGNDGYGDNDFTPDPTRYDALSFLEMQTFIGDIVNVLHQESAAPVTVGGASVGWKKAWSRVGLDFYTVHMYGWINTRWPYGTPVSSFGFDKPVVMGEFPLDGIGGAPYGKFVQTIYDAGYAGSLGWQYADSPWDTYAPAVKAFADAHPCITHY